MVTDVVNKNRVRLLVDAGMTEAGIRRFFAREPLVSSNEQLLDACMTGRATRVRELLAAGADPNARNEDGDTALIIASVQGNTETADALMEAGADPNVANVHGLTALMEASFWGNRDTVKLLLCRGADPLRSDCAGRTAIHWAVIGCQPDIELWLKEHVQNLRQ